ncbi:DUF1223-domain-containing protein [Mollisia scopiformis]|uniref:DUF1223-domain-containing protein n=1 Tax=Mollisia scopiformis TaxID=149040 RepID=A0A194WU39_MOLSC|nr:DUF1223-domain-containing protein [Mollisia scopiformis]KUJ11473.1 DUF1223-domain-containing protein [Mollisia scopiformis]
METKGDLTVVELFQSQSCSSCPPANTHLLNTIQSDSTNALLLTYEVTYWNHLSWVDTFSNPRWDERQRNYVRAMGLRSPFTPQVIVDGGAKKLDGGWWNVEKTLGMREMNGGEMVKLAISNSTMGGGKTVEVDGSETGAALVEVVWYEIEPAPVKVLRGENRGVTIPHRNVVRDLQLIGRWEGGVERFELPEKRHGLEMAILIQKERDGHILGAMRV